MILGKDEKEEAIKVLRYLGVDDETLEFIGCFDGCVWRHKFEGFLGGRDGWSGLIIDRGPDFEFDENDREYSELIEVGGIQYLICEGD